MSVCVEERNLCTQSLNSPQNPVLLPSARPRGKSFETSRHSFSWRVTKRDEWMMIRFKPSLALCSLFWFNEFVCKFAPRDRSTAKQKRVDQFYARRIFSREQTKLRSGTFFFVSQSALKRVSARFDCLSSGWCRVSGAYGIVFFVFPLRSLSLSLSDSRRSHVCHHRHKTRWTVREKPVNRISGERERNGKRNWDETFAQKWRRTLFFPGRKETKKC